MTAWWSTTTGPSLAQGDLLPNCIVPVFTGVPKDLSAGVVLERVARPAQLIVLTQSCDLVNHKSQNVALCVVSSLAELETSDPAFAKKGRWESVRKGRVEGLHMLAGPQSPSVNSAAVVVDFRNIISLPIEYLASHADSLGVRWRLQSPFLEHFSQSFARFFMRVGLPSDIPAFK